jgi:hypothetical protein
MVLSCIDTVSIVTGVRLLCRDSFILSLVCRSGGVKPAGVMFQVLLRDIGYLTLRFTSMYVFGGYANRVPGAGKERAGRVVGVAYGGGGRASGL